jgi:hypothetical protein
VVLTIRGTKVLACMFSCFFSCVGCEERKVSLEGQIVPKRRPF